MNNELQNKLDKESVIFNDYKFLEKYILKAAFMNVKRANDLLSLSAIDKNNAELSDVYQGLTERLEWCIVNIFSLIEIKEDILRLKAELDRREKEKINGSAADVQKTS